MMILKEVGHDNLGGNGQKRKGEIGQASKHNENVSLDVIVVATNKVFSLGKGKKGPLIIGTVFSSFGYTFLGQCSSIWHPHIF